MFRIFLTYLKLLRLAEIGVIITKYLFSDLTDRVTFLFSKREKTQRKVYTTPERIRQTIEELGPTYVKFGQILADRPDMVSLKFRSELKKLQSRAIPFETRTAVAIIERQLGETIATLFKEFDYTPLAAASIGQVYRATLHSGERVVIKVQRPLIENKIKLDIYLMKYLAQQVVKRNPELAAINITGLVTEFSESIIRELDYNNESSNMKLFENMFQECDEIVIPKVYDQFTSKYTIVSEYIDGVTPDSATKLDDKGFNREVIVKNGAKAIFKMILEDGIFHADPHPGNLFIVEGNKVAFIDFGMVGVLRIKEMDFLADFIVGYTSRDGESIGKSLLTLCNLEYFERRDELIFAIRRMLLSGYGERGMEIKKFSSVMQQSIDILIKFDLNIPSGIFMLIKTIATIEKFAQDLAPELDLAPIVFPYAKKLIKERNSTKRLKSRITESIENYASLLCNLPSYISEILIKLKEGKIKHDIKIEDQKIITSSARQISIRISYTILLIGLFIGATILIVWDSERRFGFFILYTSLIMILLLMLKWLFGRKN